MGRGAVPGYKSNCPDLFEINYQKCVTNLVMADSAAPQLPLFAAFTTGLTLNLLGDSVDVVRTRECRLALETVGVLSSSVSS